MCARAKYLYESHVLYREQVHHDMRALRMWDQGIFKDDIPDRRVNNMDEFVSTALRTEFDFASSWLAGMNRRVVKRKTNGEFNEQARSIQAYAQFLMESEDESYAERADMDARFIEARDFLLKGRFWIFRSVNPYYEPGESPFITRFIDPVQVVWDTAPGTMKIGRVYRYYSATMDQLVGAYGKPGDENWKKLRKIAGMHSDGDDTLIPDVVEYWDPWYRFVAVGGVPLLGPVAHKYGVLPCTAAFSPIGEPMGSVMPAEGGYEYAMNEQLWKDGMGHKTPGYITYMKLEHYQYEALMHRMQYLAKFALYPDFLRKRSSLGNNETYPDINRRPSGQYDYPDDDELEQIKVDPNAGPAMDVVVNSVKEDRARGRAPDSAIGGMNDGQPTQTAQRAMSLAGQGHWRPWAASLDSLRSRDLTAAVEITKNIGPELRDHDGRPFQMTVPNVAPSRGESNNFTITPEAVQSVGARVKVISDSQDPGDWLLKMQSLKLGTENGIPRSELIPRLFSIDYDEVMAAESFEEQAMVQAMQLPEFAKMVSVPFMMARQLEEVKGNPDLTDLFQKMADGWMAVAAEPALLEVETQKIQLKMQLIQLKQQELQLQQMMMNPMGMMGPGGQPVPPGVSATSGWR